MLYKFCISKGWEYIEKYKRIYWSAHALITCVSSIKMEGWRVEEENWKKDSWFYYYGNWSVVKTVGNDNFMITYTVRNEFFPEYDVACDIYVKIWFITLIKEKACFIKISSKKLDNLSRRVSFSIASIYTKLIEKLGNYYK